MATSLSSAILETRQGSTSPDARTPWRSLNVRPVGFCCRFLEGGAFGSNTKKKLTARDSIFPEPTGTRRRAGDVLIWQKVGRPTALPDRCQRVLPYRVGRLTFGVRPQVARGFARHISCCSMDMPHATQAAKPRQSARKLHKSQPSEAVLQTGIASPVRQRRAFTIRWIDAGATPISPAISRIVAPSLRSAAGVS
jgi:hypothetical protein